MKKRLSSMVCFLLIASLMTGCSPKAPKAPEEGTEDLKKIVYALSSEPETLDPIVNKYSRSSIVLQNLFRGLYKIDENDQTVPALAQDCKIDEAGLVYTFTLRDGIKWSDGSPITAQDFEYSWKRVLSPEIASGASWYLYYIKNAEAYNNGKATAEEVGVKALDEKTLEVTLEGPTAYFLDLLAVTAYYPVKKDIVEAPEVWTKSPDTYVCSGPYMLKEIKTQEKYVLVKNPNYIDADKVKVDQIDIVFIESPESELAAYTNGEIDVSDNMSNESIKQYQGTEDFVAAPRIGTYYFDINCSVKPFDDARVRKALAMAIDRKKIIENIIQASNAPAFGFVPYGIPYATEPSKNYRDVVGNLFTEDVAEAKKLLAEAGFPDGKGFPMVKFIVMNSQGDKDISQAMQSMWKENLGIESEIVTFESKVYWDELDKGEFHVARDGWTGDYPDPMTNLDLFESTNTADDCRWIGSGSERYDALLKENRVITDKQKRMDNFQEAETILMNEMPILPLYFMDDTMLVKPHVKGVIKSYIGHTIFEYADVVK